MDKVLEDLVESDSAITLYVDAELTSLKDRFWALNESRGKVDNQISELFEFVSSNVGREFPDCPERISTSWKFPAASPSVLSIVTISDPVCPASTVMLTDSGITFNFGVARPTPEREISCGPFSALLVKTETDW